MKRILSVLILTLLLSQPSYAETWTSLFDKDSVEYQQRAITKMLKSQVRYANKNNFEKFISTYSDNYKNSDGFDLNVYSTLVKNFWETYGNIKYGVEIKKITLDENKAIVEVCETSFAEIPVSKLYDGELKSSADAVYYLEKFGKRWKVVSDRVLDETTTMLYGEAKDLDIRLTVPLTIGSNTDYTASLEFVPPSGTLAIASIAADKVEYPQKPTKEVFRTLPDDNILERIFTSNDENANEYVVASIGLTKTSVCDLSVKMSLTGFGYAIKRVNVLPKQKEIEEGESNE